MTESRRDRIAAQAALLRPKPVVLPSAPARPRIQGTLSLPGFRAKAPPPTPVTPPPLPTPKRDLDAIKKAIAWMTATWPSAFAKPVRPLAMGVSQAIVAARPDGMSPEDV